MIIFACFEYTISRKKSGGAMIEKITSLLGCMVAIFVLPCILTMLMSGRKQDASSQLLSCESGRDILVQTKNGNELLDIEQYIAGIMPGCVDASATDEYMQAQAVALRTQIVYTMGKETVYMASNLDFKYYTEQDYLAKWGEGYPSVKERYEQAVLATQGKIIE